MDSELDRTYDPYARNEEFERALDEWHEQVPDPEEADFKERRLLHHLDLEREEGKF